MSKYKKRDLFPHDKYREILLLKHFLEEEKIPFELRPDLDGYAIAVPHFKKSGTARAIENMASYDSGLDLLEVRETTGRIHIDATAETAMMIIRDEYRKYMNY